ncbi:MauE/DoxX family redox-associated membrane protein [uncultured Desulfosarcina sp.]|uniref:MauE/DoxX family redox-associated membrane protein n=1 Tax=uncultured Desulfosarcina sp. TaxID=218289 RepID=UPI0029C9AC8E|nr:MauE/DoxX family redox-associated membrane protein [uncultured Desulfosarcina sp.]
MRPQTASHEDRIMIFIRIGLGAVFLFSSAGKIADPRAFMDIVAHYRLLPPSLVWATAVFLPWIEALCGLALVFGRFEKGAALLVSVMMVGFIAVTVFNGYRGLDVACGCFSVTARKPSNIALNSLRDLFILAAGLWVLFYTHRPRPQKAC